MHFIISLHRFNYPPAGLTPPTSREGGSQHFFPPLASIHFQPAGTPPSPPKKSPASEVRAMVATFNATYFFFGDIFYRIFPSEDVCPPPPAPHRWHPLWWREALAEAGAHDHFRVWFDWIYGLSPSKKKDLNVAEGGENQCHSLCTQGLLMLL